MSSARGASRSRMRILVGLVFAGSVVAHVPAPPSCALQSRQQPALVRLGDSVFHGKAGGGVCFMCHGVDAKGTPGLAPDLTAGKSGKKKWLHGDGTCAAIIGIVQQGVPDPKENPSPMPPMGGASLTPAQVRAVAAYVYSLSHPAEPDTSCGRADVAYHIGRF